MKAVIDREEFRLCEVPVPQGYPQSQTHCGVAMLNNVLFLSTSPFPNPKRNYKTIAKALIRKITRGKYYGHYGEYYENPCLYIGQPDNYPISVFRLVPPAPLMRPPYPLFGMPSFNSDPDIFVDGDKICVLNRVTFRKKNGYFNQIFIIKGRYNDGLFFCDGYNLLTEAERCYISPCIIKYQNKWIITYLDTNSYNDGNTFKGLFIKEMSQLVPFEDNNNDWRRISLVGDNRLPWHMSLFLYEDKLYSIISSVNRNDDHRCVQMLGVFNKDLTELYIYPRPLCDMNSYRGGAYVDEKGLFIFYTTTVHEKIKGSKAIDGRNVMVSSKPFDEIIKEAGKI